MTSLLTRIWRRSPRADHLTSRFTAAPSVVAATKHSTCSGTPQERYGFAIEEVEIDSDPDLVAQFDTCGAGVARQWQGAVPGCGQARAFGPASARPRLRTGRPLTWLQENSMAWVLPDDCVLGIWGEKPEPEHLNPTFSAEWGPDFASELHEAMLFDTLETWAADNVLAPGGRRVLVYAPADAGPGSTHVSPPRSPSSLATRSTPRSELTRVLCWRDGGGSVAGRHDRLRCTDARPDAHRQCVSLP